MKQYTLYLYTKLDDCMDYQNYDECYIHNCPNCELSSYIIYDDNNTIIESKVIFDISDYKKCTEQIFIVETNDVIGKNNFAQYLKNKDNNYRLIDFNTRQIIKYNDSDSELIMELIDNYDEKIVDELCDDFNLDYILQEKEGSISSEFITSIKIKDLKIHRNASVIIASGFILANTLALQANLEQTKFINIAIAGVSLLCGTKNISNIQTDNIKIKAGKRLIKKIKDKRNQNT